MVGHALKVRQQVIEDKALVQSAYALLQPINVMTLHFVTQGIYDLLQRLHPAGILHIAGDEGIHRQVQNFSDGLLQHSQFVLCLLGENDILFVDLLSTLGDVQRMVADTFKIGNGVQIFGNLFALPCIQRLNCDLHKVGAQLILKTVDGILLLLNVLKSFVAVGADKLQCIHQIAAGGVGHSSRDLPTLLNSQSRMLQKTLLQPIHFQLSGICSMLVRDQEADKPLQMADERCQDNHGGQTKQSVQQSNGHSGHGHGQKREVGKGIHRIKHRCPNRHTQHVNKQIDKGGTASTNIGTKRTEQNRHGGADSNAHDNRKSNLKGHSAGDSQCLHNTDSGRCALEDAGEDYTHQNAQKRIGKAGE